MSWGGRRRRAGPTERGRQPVGVLSRVGAGRGGVWQRGASWPPAGIKLSPRLIACYAVVKNPLPAPFLPSPPLPCPPRYSLPPAGIRNEPKSPCIPPTLSEQTCRIPPHPPDHCTAVKVVDNLLAFSKGSQKVLICTYPARKGTL